MIKKFRHSLTIKIFFITFLLLVFVCALTYGFIARFIPMTYTSTLNKELNGEAQQLVKQLERSKLSNYSKLLTRFANSTAASLEVLDSKNRVVKAISPASSLLLNSGDTEKEVLTENLDSTKTVTDVLPGKSTDNEKGISITTAEKDATYTINQSTAADYKFKLLDSREPYTITIIGSTRAVNQVVEAINLVLPWLILSILAISILSSIFYARFITRPIVKISSISNNMSKLIFDWNCEEKRSDEIGVLGRSLNELSRKLSAALSELKDANISLQKDINREREVERQRLEFFCAVSHELKTPITVMKGQLEGMLGNVGAYKDHDKYLARSLNVADRMEKIVQEILTISRMEASGFTLHKKTFDLTTIVNKKLEHYSELLEHKKLRLFRNLKLESFVCADYVLLEKAIDNLLSNAVFYSPTGQIIKIEVCKIEKGIYLSIENTGVHIKEEVLNRVFEAFYRGEQSRSRQTGGSGLGLYVVKSILEQHGAEFKIENTADGVRFAFTLP